MKGIADTGFPIAFANANDKHHAWAVQIAADVTEPLLTCEAVMAETAFHLNSTAVALAMLNEGRWFRWRLTAATISTSSPGSPTVMRIGRPTSPICASSG